MRVLVSVAGGAGHLVPVLPFARALRGRGHDVRVAGQAGVLPVAEAAGFAAVDTGGDTLAAPRARAPLAAVDRGHELDVVRRVFAGSVARERAGRTADLIARWGPDVVLRDEVDLGALVAAEAAGVPHVGVVVLAAGGVLRPDVVAGPLDVLRAERGLAPDPGLAALHRHLTLVPVPPGFRDRADPLPATARPVRPAALEPSPPDDVATARTLAWLASRRGGRPAVYLTLGTVFPQESGDLFARLLAGVTAAGVDAVVTVGPALDPAELGSAPDTVHVERFVAQQRVVPRCDAVVSHAGSGTVVGALAAGVPLVVLPLGADQPWVADRCAALGVARVLDPLDADPAAIAAALGQVLTDPAYRAAARRVAASVAGLPTADDAAGWAEVSARAGTLDP